MIEKECVDGDYGCGGREYIRTTRVHHDKSRAYPDFPSLLLSRFSRISCLIKNNA